MPQSWIGTSGWSYPNWEGPFYPKGLKRTDWLAFYGERLDSVEMNNSFYRLPKAEMLSRWAERTPGDFLFAVKGSRLVTHLKRLKGCEEPLEIFFERMTALGDKLGPVLFQLPPNFPCDLPLLRAFLQTVPEGHRYTVEFRDPSWHVPEVSELLSEHNAAFCIFELGTLRSPELITADFAYIRLHGPGERYVGNYDEATLGAWAQRLRAWRQDGKDSYVYFDNTDEADYALRNALRLKELTEAPESR
ncbi:MAG: DUF72 domain-containing protein [Alphaproteobacteria bacterium]